MTACIVSDTVSSVIEVNASSRLPGRAVDVILPDQMFRAQMSSTKILSGAKCTTHLSETGAMPKPDHTASRDAATDTARFAPQLMHAAASLHYVGVSNGSPVSVHGSTAG